MSSIARRAAVNRHLKQKSPTAEKKEFSGFARRQDAEIPGVFQGRQHSKTQQFTHSRRISDCIVYTKLEKHTAKQAVIFKITIK